MYTQNTKKRQGKVEEWRWYIESDHAAMMAEMKTSLGLTFNRHFLFFTNNEIASDAD